MKLLRRNGLLALPMVILGTILMLTGCGGGGGGSVMQGSPSMMGVTGNLTMHFTLSRDELSRRFAISSNAVTIHVQLINQDNVSIASQTVPVAQIADGVSFTNLPLGPLTVVVNSLDGNGNTLQEGSATVDIAPGQNQATVTLSNGQFVAVANGGSNTVTVFTVSNAATGTLTRLADVTVTNGGTAVSPLGLVQNGVTAFVVVPAGGNGSQSGVLSFTLDPITGQPTQTTPNAVPVPNAPALGALALDPTGRFLYVVDGVPTSPQLSDPGIELAGGNVDVFDVQTNPPQLVANGGQALSGVSTLTTTTAGNNPFLVAGTGDFGNSINAFPINSNGSLGTQSSSFNDGGAFVSSVACFPGATAFGMATTDNFNGDNACTFTLSSTGQLTVVSTGILAGKGRGRGIVTAVVGGQQFFFMGTEDTATANVFAFAVNGATTASTPDQQALTADGAAVAGLAFLNAASSSNQILYAANAGGAGNNVTPFVVGTGGTLTAQSPAAADSTINDQQAIISTLSLQTVTKDVTEEWAVRTTE